MNESRSFPDVFPRAADGRGPPLESFLPLARRVDFKLGAATVRPSVRTVDGPGGSAAAEPRVMQVLLALADAEGAVLTRDDLIRSCWNGQVVGDDSINRAISEIRRIARETAAGFVVETIPRIGYRVSGISGSETAAANDDSPSPKISRRTLIAGALAASAAGGAG